MKKSTLAGVLRCVSRCLCGGDVWGGGYIHVGLDGREVYAFDLLGD